MLRWGAVAAVLGMGGAAVHAGAIRFVDDDAALAGGGLSWDTAYRFLQDALADAEAAGGAVTEIRVAQGVYRPDQDEAGNITPGDREASFHLLSGVALRGGFLGLSAGKGQDPDDRDLTLYATFLSGDLAGNDGPDFANNAENAYHVVIGSGTDTTALIEGFRITAGNANGPQYPDIHTWGAGMFNDQGDPTVMRCVFHDNITLTVFTLSGEGGGMFNFASNPTIVECEFVHNVGGSGGGGGMGNWNSNPLVIDSLFRENGAIVNGGGAGMANFNSHPLVVGCRFIDNVSDTGTGGHGGGMSCQNSHPRLVGCLFQGNYSDGSGGALSCNGPEATPMVLNCLFLENTSALAGGAFTSNWTSHPRVINCTFSGNVTGQYGGGGIASGGPATILNSVSWGNEPDELADDGAMSVQNCNVEGGWPGPGNIDTDPLFADPAGGDYRLALHSPCIDAGHNNAIAELAETDYDGNPRFADGPADDSGCGVPVVVDIGAYEFEGPSSPVRLGDLDGDGVVNVLDLLDLLAAWGHCMDACCLADLDLDGDVSVNDFLTLLGKWGPA